MALDNQRVIVHRRGGEEIEWTSDEGLNGFSLTPFGIVAEFEGQELRSEFIPWSDVVKLQVFDSDYKVDKGLHICPTCDGKGLLDKGLLLCATCDGYGSVREKSDDVENGPDISRGRSAS